MAEGDIGDITTLKSGALTTIRDITITCKSKTQLDQVISNIESIDNGVKIHAVTDDVLKGA